MPPSVLHARLRAPMIGGGIYTKTLNYTGPIAVDKLRLYYPATDGRVVGVRNVVPPPLSGLTDANTLGGDIGYHGNEVNNIGYEEHGYVLRSLIGGAGNWVSLGDQFRNWSPPIFTVFAWIKPITINGADQSTIIEHGEGSFNSFNLGFGFDGATASKFYIYTRGGGSFPTLFSSSSAAVDKISFVAATWDATTTQMFVDGVKETTMASTGAATTTGATWQFGTLAGAHNLDGHMWGMGLFERVLEDWEIEYLYRNPWTLIDGMGNFDNVVAGGNGGEWRL